MTQSLSSISTGPRQTNMELLRIVAMALVLIVHADFFALGSPDCHDLQINPLSSSVRIFFEALAIVCVNIFVLISGWFKIRPSIRGFLNFIFQCFFFYVGIYAVMIALGSVELSLKGILQCIGLLPGSWFIKAYIGLYILSPVLNAFCDVATPKQLCFTTLAFYIFQTIYRCTGAVSFFEFGYSTMSFIGLYLLAQSIKLYTFEVYKWGGVIYLITTIALSLIYILVLHLELSPDFWMMKIFGYNNPLVVFSSLSIFMWFTTLNIKYNRFINWLSASSFAVFLFHCNPNILHKVYLPSIRSIYDQYDGLMCILLILVFLVAIYTVSVLLDQVRIMCWQKISGKLEL